MLRDDTICDKAISSQRATGVVALIVHLLANVPVARAGDDFGSWHALSLKFHDDERWTLSAVGQLRFRDASSEWFAYQLSPQVVYKVSPYLRLGMNYTYLPTKPPGSDDFLDQHRWETEINPRWPVNGWLTLDLRNRFELRWLEGRRGTNERSRHRPQANLKVKGLGPLESIFINNEFFYDYVAHRYSENRLVPLGLSFHVSEHVGFSTYYMLQSVRANGDWNNSHVLGTQLSVAF